MDIPEIKSHLSIETVLAYYGLRADKNNRLLCPFHQDKTPSLQVYPPTNTWTCFSSNCDAGSGDAIEFIQRMDKISKHEALLKAAELIDNGKWAMDNEKTVKDVTVLAKESLSDTYLKLKAVLQKNTKALSYLKERGLESVECGYNTGKEMEGMKHCIIFPLKNKSGDIVSLYGRNILNNDTAKHYYSSGRQGLYPGYPSADTNTLILTEAVIDAASVLEAINNYQLVINNKAFTVLACYGTNGLTSGHLVAIKTMESLQEVIFFFDGDKAGNLAVEKHSATLHEMFPQIQLSRVVTPEGEDINSLWANYGGEAIKELISERDFLFSTEKNKESEIKVSNGAESVLNTANPELITYQSGVLEFLLLGGLNLQGVDRLKVTVKVSRSDSQDPLHSIRHSLDLYHADYLERFILKAAEQLETGTAPLRRALAELTEELERYRFSRIESLKVRRPLFRELSEEQRKKAVAYLKSPDLLVRTNFDIGRTGVVGEETNRLLMYLVFTSRFREQPLHIISLGSSGTGKTYLQEKVSELIPESDKLEITILSENAFYYFGQKELKHKLVLIEDLDGAMEVLYPLRELQTKRKISKTIPVKDSKGNLKTVTLHVEGPISLAGTTTKERLYEDNANRSLLIYLDNTPAHREAVMDYQRRVSAGKVDTRKEVYLKEFFKDMQSILKPVKVRNPYAEYLKLPDSVFKPLRTHAHYLQFIELVTFYHQYQRELKSDGYGAPYIETTIEDIESANELLKDILLAKSDELPRALRDFFEGIKYYLKSTAVESFYARDVRSRLRMNPMSVNRYIHELEARGYVKRSGGNRKGGYEYTVGQWHEYDKLHNSMQLLSQIVADLKCNKYNNAVQSGSVILKSSETLAK